MAVDQVAPILAADPTITDEQRADLWDVFNSSKDATELEQHLQPLVLPDELKQNLIDKKKRTIPKVEPLKVAGPLDKTTAVIQKMTQIDPKALDLAEAHPNVLKSFMTEVSGAEKGKAGSKPSTEAASPSEPAAEGKTTPSTPFPPRPDGQPHFPPITPNHYRVLASDNSVHDIPVENIEEARKIDPLLHVLNP